MTKDLARAWLRKMKNEKSVEAIAKKSARNEASLHVERSGVL